MVIQTHGHGGFPFCLHGFCTGGLADGGFRKQQGHVDDPNLHVGDSNAFNSPNLALQFEKQWQELDQYIKFQNDQLRLMIQQQGKQQVTALLKNMESRTNHILMKKNEELAQAMQKRQELEEFIKKLEVENQEWKRLAHEKEATVLALYKALEEEEEKKEKMVVNDVESCVGENEQELMENRLRGCGVGSIDPREVCKGCYTRKLCFLFLPCRHLASCKVCEPYLHACLVCGMMKKASIETLIM